jgi:hypothetical protein
MKYAVFIFDLIEKLLKGYSLFRISNTKNTLTKLLPTPSPSHPTLKIVVSKTRENTKYF